jgi:argininosuccinate lyase
MTAVPFRTDRSPGRRRLAAAGLLGLALACARADAANGGASALHDNFFWLNEFNKASIVMTVEQGIMPADVAQKTARAVAQVIVEGDKPGGKRPGDYAQLEPMIIKIAGPDAARMNSGRSTQDILATTRRAMLRDRLLDLYEALNQAHANVNALAGKYADAIVPAYADGVQAQPTTYGHYLLGFSAVLDRDAQRLRQAYARVNLSPMGAGDLATSTFPVDRKRLAELLGFDGVDDNSYDAAQFAQIDIGAEAASLASTMALSVGAFVQEIHTQYRQVQPWLTLRPGKQGAAADVADKGDPRGLDNVRLQASVTVGDAMTALMAAHNVTPGMPDYKREQAQDAVESATDMYLQLDGMLDGLVLDRERALAEVDADYVATRELADALQRDANVPFRIGRHFAGELVAYARKNKLPKAADIPYADAQRMYAQAAKKFGVDNAKLPFDETLFRQVLTPQNMIAASKGLGGPQPGEVARMLGDAKQRLESDQAWVQAARDKLMAAQDNLDRAFDDIANPPPKKK